jgi:hypothetical protein
VNCEQVRYLPPTVYARSASESSPLTGLPLTAPDATFTCCLGTSLHVNEEKLLRQHEVSLQRPVIQGDIVVVHFIL